MRVYNPSSGDSLLNSLSHRGQVLTYSLAELALRAWPGRCDLSLPVRCTTSHRAVTDGKLSFGLWVTAGFFSMRWPASEDGSTGLFTPTA